MFKFFLLFFVDLLLICCFFFLVLHFSLSYLLCFPPIFVFLYFLFSSSFFPLCILLLPQISLCFLCVIPLLFSSLFHLSSFNSFLSSIFHLPIFMFLPLSLPRLFPLPPFLFPFCFPFYVFSSSSYVSFILPFSSFSSFSSLLHLTFFSFSYLLFPFPSPLYDVCSFSLFIISLNLFFSISLYCSFLTRFPCIISFLFFSHSSHLCAFFYTHETFSSSCQSSSALYQTSACLSVCVYVCMTKIFSV